MATDLEKISENEREDIIEEILSKYGSKTSKGEEKVTDGTLSRQASKYEKEDIIEEILSKYSSKASKDEEKVTDETLSRQASKDEKEDIIEKILSEYGNSKSTKGDYIPETIHSISTSNDKEPTNKIEKEQPIPKKQSRFANMLRGIFSKITNKNKKTLLLETSNAKTERNLSKTKNEPPKKGFFNRMKSFLFGKREHNEIPDSKESNQTAIPKRYTSRGGKLGALILAASMLGSSSVANLEDTQNLIDDNSNRLIEELPDKENEFLDEKEIPLQNDNAEKIDWKSVDELDRKTIGESADIDSENIAVEKDIADGEKTIEESSSIDSNEITVEMDIADEETKVNEAERVEKTIGESSSADSNEIAVETDNTQEEDIYSNQLFRASENGIRTREEILFVLDKVRWDKSEKEHIKENIMDGLLYIQENYDIDPLCALAIFHWEGQCGLFHLENCNQRRVANIIGWKGQNDGVIGYSRDGMNYCVYNTFFEAVDDFGSYVKTSPALEGATTMYDLEFNKGLHIFVGAAKEGAYTYSRLKEYAKEYEKEIGIEVDDVKDAVEECTAEDIQQMTSTIKSEIQKEDSIDKENEGERNDL